MMRKGSEMRSAISAIITNSLSQKEAIEALAQLMDSETSVILEEVSEFTLNKSDDGYIRSLKRLGEMRLRLKG